MSSVTNSAMHACTARPPDRQISGCTAKCRLCLGRGSASHAHRRAMTRRQTTATNVLPGRTMLPTLVQDAPLNCGTVKVHNVHVACTCFKSADACVFIGCACALSVRHLRVGKRPQDIVRERFLSGGRCIETRSLTRGVIPVVIIPVSVVLAVLLLMHSQQTRSVQTSCSPLAKGACVAKNARDFHIGVGLNTARSQGGDAGCVVEESWAAETLWEMRVFSCVVPHAVVPKGRTAVRVRGLHRFALQPCCRRCTAQRGQADDHHKACGCR